MGRLSRALLIDIGTLEGDPVYEFFRVVGVSELGDGRIVVANAGTGELRFYDSDGKHLVSSGRLGQGPGEFKDLWWLQVIDGDSLVTWDWRNARGSVFTARGDFARSFTFRSLIDAGTLPTPVAVLSDRSLLMTIEPHLRTDTVRTQVRRDSIIYARGNMDGALTDTIGVFPGGEYFTKQWGRGAVSQLPRAFGRYPQLAVNGEGFYFGSSDSYEIDYFTSTGKRIRSIRLDRPNRRVTTRDIERYKDELIEDWGELRERAKVIANEMPYPETMPAYGAIRVDETGNLWVASYPGPAGEPTRWKVFSPDGELVADIETPAGFTIYQIGADFVIGKWEDDLGVEHVRKYRLLKD